MGHGPRCQRQIMQQRHHVIAFPSCMERHGSSASEGAWELSLGIFNSTAA